MKKIISLLILLSLASGTGHCVWDSKYDAYIRDLSEKYEIPVELILAVIKAESGFKFCISPKGAVGYMQLMPETARELNVKDIYNPSDNIAGGVKYLDIMLDKYRNIPLALAAYNAGPGAVDRYGSIPPYPETVKYVFKVLEYCDNYKKNMNNKDTIVFKITSGE